MTNANETDFIWSKRIQDNYDGFIGDFKALVDVAGFAPYQTRKICVNEVCKILASTKPVRFFSTDPVMSTSPGTYAS